MTNIDPTIQTSPATPPPAGPPPAPLDGGAGEGAPIDWEAKFNAEVANHQRERNFYKPLMRTFGNWDPETRQAVADFHALVDKGDVDGITDFAAQTISNLHGGKSAAEVIAAKQATAEQAMRPSITGQPSQPAPQYLTREEAEALAERKVTETLTLRETRATQQALIESELKAHGYEISSPAGRTIIQRTIDTGAKTFEDAVKWFEGDVVASVTARQQAAAAAAAQVPAGAPTGSAPATAPAAEMGWKERAVARLTAVNG